MYQDWERMLGRSRKDNGLSLVLHISLQGFIFLEASIRYTQFYLKIWTKEDYINP